VNKVYKAVWNDRSGTYVAVAETAKANGKRTRSGAVGIAAAVGLLVLVSNDASANIIDSGTCNTGAGTLNGISYAL
jgi:Extended Signal Peptide of Type V secretion system